MFGATGTNLWQPVSISMIMEQQQVTYSRQHLVDSSFQIPSRGKNRMTLQGTIHSSKHPLQNASMIFNSFCTQVSTQNQDSRIPGRDGQAGTRQ